MVGDLGLLERVLANLLSNAATHTPPGTSVRVSATSERGTVIVAVEDDGPGIPQDDIRHLGEYAKTFGEEGFDVRRSGSRIVSAFLAILTFGSLRPATVIATRSASAPGR